MILMNGIEPSAIMLGDTAVSAVYQGSELIWSGKKRYGGIEVLYDSACYIYSRGMIYEYQVEETEFIALVDSGSSATKPITFGYSNKAGTGASDDILSHYVRCYNSLDADSIDYWTVQNQNRYIASMLGRYYAFTINKQYAKYFFVHDNTNQRYLIKGDKASIY